MHGLRQTSFRQASRLGQSASTVHSGFGSGTKKWVFKNCFYTIYNCTILNGNYMNIVEYEHIYKQDLKKKIEVFQKMKVNLRKRSEYQNNVFSS